MHRFTISFICFSCSLMKSMISRGIETAYEFPTYLNLTLKFFFLRF